MQEHVPTASAKLVCFNLGYLPQTDHTVKTEVDTTLRALQAAMETVMVGGLVTVMVYVGHSGAPSVLCIVIHTAVQMVPLCACWLRAWSMWGTVVCPASVALSSAQLSSTQTGWLMSSGCRGGA